MNMDEIKAAIKNRTNLHIEENLQDLSKQAPVSSVSVLNKSIKSPEDNPPGEIMDSDNHQREPQKRQNSKELAPYQPLSLLSDYIQSQTEANNRTANFLNSQIARSKAEERASDEYMKNLFREQLSYKIIDPLPKDFQITEPFPVDILPENVNRLIRSVSHSLQVPIEVVGAALLGVIFIAARGNFKIKVNKDYIEALTEYIMVAAPSGKGKSTVVSWFRKFITEIEMRLQKDYNVNIGEHQMKHFIMSNKLNEEKKKIIKKTSKLNLDGALSMAKPAAERLALIENHLMAIPAKPRFLIDSPTLKELAMAMKRQGEAMGLFEAEGGIWKNCVRSADDNILLKGYTMEEFSAETKTSGSVIMTAPCFAICSVLQPGIARKSYSDPALVDHGLMARILPVFAPPMTGIPDADPMDVPENLEEWFGTKIESLLSLKRPEGREGERTFHILELNPESKRIFKKYMKDVSAQIHAGEFKKLEAFGEKLRGHALRLAGAVHLLEFNEPQQYSINESAMKAGIALAQFFAVHAKAAFDPERVEGHKYAKKILIWMNKNRKHSFTARDFYRDAGCKAALAEMGFKLLEQHGYLGRPVVNSKTTIVVNPWHDFRYVESD